jgi:hypothetical protein
MATTTLLRRSRSARAAACAVVALGLLATASCGGGYYEDPYYDPYVPAPVHGTVEVDNVTDTTTFEDVYTFYLSPSGSGAWTENLLSGPLPPGFAEVVGDFVEDFYDAEADVGDFGDVAFWDGVFVPGGDITTFEVF